MINRVDMLMAIIWQSTLMPIDESTNTASKSHSNHINKGVHYRAIL